MMTDSLKFDIVVCQDIHGGIGKDGKLPWNVPEEMAFFKKLTAWTEDPNKHNAVIMGRKTWESLPDKARPLPGRVNAVLTKNDDNLIKLIHAGASLSATTLDKTLETLDEMFDVERVFVIGGAEVYQEALNHPGLELIHLSTLYQGYDCDTFLELPDNLEIVAEATHVEFKSYLLRKN